MDTRAAADRFARTWQEAWRQHDVDAIAALYAADCTHRSMPFRPVHEGRAAVADYVRWAFSTRTRPSCVLAPRWWTATWPRWSTGRPRSSDGAQPATLAGVGLLRFDADGLVVEARDYWHTAEGHQRPTGLLFFPSGG